jgi:ureidoglycolate dehydrogenase (NAD+)
VDYGHKGYGLALMVDLLCGPLQGNPFGPDIPGMFSEMDAQRKLGAFFIFIDPRRFAGGELLAMVVGQMAERLKGEPGSPLVPGDPENRTALQRQSAGIPVERGLALELNAWSEKLGVCALSDLAVHTASSHQ